MLDTGIGSIVVKTADTDVIELPLIIHEKLSMIKDYHFVWQFHSFLLSAGVTQQLRLIKTSIFMFRARMLTVTNPISFQQLRCSFTRYGGIH